MPKVDWFRRKTWSTDDATDFQARLKRARTTFNKAQYLRIQAVELQAVGNKMLTTVALSLLNQLVAEFPDGSQLSAAHMQRAACYADLQQFDEALRAYRSAFDARRAAPNWQNDAPLEFGTLVVALNRAELFDEVLSIFEEFGDPGPFPTQRYSEAATRALIADQRGDQVTALRWALVAIDAANLPDGPFKRHAQLGVVRSVDPVGHRRLHAIARQHRANAI